MSTSNDNFKKALKKIKKLKNQPEILGAYVFGSVARGEQDINSDIDVIVQVKDNGNCDQINHPLIFGIKCDLSFKTLEQIVKSESEISSKGERPPFIANSIILFDKTGELKKLKIKYSKFSPPQVKPEEFQLISFMIIHSTNKAFRHLDIDPHSAHLAMNINLNDILRFHYRLQGHWWVSNKFLLSNLRIWDPKLARLVEKFVLLQNVHQKFELWQIITNHVSTPLGGIKQISSLNCKCPSCQKNLRMFECVGR